MQAVDVWWCHWAEAPRGLERLLSADEIHRYSRFSRESDRLRFAVGAAMVRVLASRELRIAPAAIEIDRRCGRCGGPHGRVSIPSLRDLNVSVTHSGALVGVARFGTAPVGLDVETMVAGRDYFEDLWSILTQQERASLSRVPSSELDEALLRLWTRKEAVVKAAGEGLMADTAEIDIGVPNSSRLRSWRNKPKLLVDIVAMADVQTPSSQIASVAALSPSPLQVLVHDGLELLTGI